MHDDDSPIPRDPFSKRLRELRDNPGAVRATSTINRQDWYGNAESWIVDTFRVDTRTEVFLQRIGAGDPIRLHLPPDVTDAISRQRDRAVTVIRKRAARTAVATKRARGDVLGNIEALKKAVARKKR
jgi:hypothetical protein